MPTCLPLRRATEVAVATGQQVRLSSLGIGARSHFSRAARSPFGPFRGGLLVQLLKGRGGDVDRGPLNLVPFADVTHAGWA
jgi:hypothetical protein